MIAPRGIHEQIGGQLRPQLCQELLFHQLVLVEAVIEKLGHRQADQGRILHRPHVREVGEEAKLQRQRLLVLRDVRVHARGVSLELRLLRSRHDGHRSLGHLPQSQDALLAVKLDVLRTQHRRQFARSETAGHVHLPQPVLRGNVSLREQQVAQVGRRNVGNAQRVVGHDNRAGKARQMNGSVHLRQRGLHRAIEPEVEAEEGDQQQHQDRYHHAEDEFAVGRAGRRGNRRGYHGNFDCNQELGGVARQFESECQSQGSIGCQSLAATWWSSSTTRVGRFTAM